MTAARRRMVRWGLRTALLVALVALVSVDARMKGGEFAGFSPANAGWVAYAPHFSTAWSRLSRTSAFRGFSKQWPVPYNKAQLAVRLTSGIRPTPLRWSTWLGKKAVIFGSDEGIGWCVKPGLLLRGAHRINALVSRAAAPGTFRYGPYYYSWREGFLLFSTSPDVLHDASSGLEFRCNESVARDEIYVEWRSRPQGFVVIGAREDLPVRGEIAVGAQGTGDGTTPWPEAPFFELRSTESSVVQESVKWMRRGFASLPGWTGLSNVVPDLDPMAVEAKYPGEIAEFGLALFKPRDPASKMPEAAMRFRLQRDFPADLQVAVGEMPIEGWAVSGKRGYVATGRNLLETLTSLSMDAAPVPGMAVANLDWGAAGKAFEMHFRDRLGENEALGDLIEGTAIPATQGISALGTLHLEGHRENGVIAFRGTLAHTLPEEPKN